MQFLRSQQVRGWVAEKKFQPKSKAIVGTAGNGARKRDDDF